MDLTTPDFLRAETVVPDDRQVYTDFRYPTKSTGHTETLATHLELEGFGVELHDFNRSNEQGSYAHRRDDYVDTVTSRSAGFASCVNSTNFNLSGSGWYFNEKCPLTARDLIGRDYHDIYEYVYAVNQIHHGYGESLSGPAMRVVSEAIELGWGVAVVPDDIRVLAQTGYDQWYAQALKAASEGRVGDAYADVERAARGYALLGNDFDAVEAVDRINIELEDSKAMTIFTRAKLKAESQSLAQKFMTDMGVFAVQDALASAE